MPFDLLNHRFIDLKSHIFGWSRSRNWFRCDFVNLNYRFLDFIEIAFWASPEAQNKLRVPSKPFKNHFFDLTQVAFWVGQEAGNYSKWYATLWNIAFSTLQKSHGWTRGSIWVHSDWRPPETTLFHLHPRRNLGWYRRRNCVPSDWRAIKTSLFRPHAMQLHFELVHRPKTSWECHSRTLIIAFSTSPKSHIGMVKRPKMSSKWQASPWNISSRPQLSPILGWSKGRKSV